MAGEQLESAVLTVLDTTPIVFPTAGEGAPDELQSNEDLIKPTATGTASTSSTYTMGPRIPTRAKIKHVNYYGTGLDSNVTAALAGDINLIWSDSAYDGTPTNLQGLIPKSTLDGTTTTEASYTSANKMFGSAILLAANSGGTLIKEITHVNTFTYAMKQEPLWQVLGTVNAAGTAADLGGYLNFYIVVTTAAGTAAAGTIGLEVEYAV